jgi:hypothetical protein
VEEGTSVDRLPSQITAAKEKDAEWRLPFFADKEKARQQWKSGTAPAKEWAKAIASNSIPISSVHLCFIPVKIPQLTLSI